MIVICLCIKLQLFSVSSEWSKCWLEFYSHFPQIKHPDHFHKLVTLQLLLQLLLLVFEVDVCTPVLTFHKANYVGLLHVCENSADMYNAITLKKIWREIVLIALDTLYGLVQFVQFKKLKPPTSLKVTLPHGCFSYFLNCTNGSKLHKASIMLNLFIYLMNLNWQSGNESLLDI